MANASETGANFLHGLSDLWIRFFKDKNQLEALYKGTELLMGQAYLDLMESVLSLSIREAPLFSKSFFKLLAVREDRVASRLDGKFEFEVSDIALKHASFLYNKIFDPTVVLEEFTDFSFELDEKDLIVFEKNPFDWLGDGSNEVIPGVAYRTLALSDGSTVRELAFWIPDAECDGFNLYLNFGSLLNRFEPSSEAYRALIQGVVRYFVQGPAPDVMTGALNVIVGLPVIRDDNEILQRVETLSDRQIVVTQSRSYEFALAVPLREDILDPQSWADTVGGTNALVFQSFDYLSRVFRVYDWIERPNWWYELIIPLDLMPDEPRDRRLVTPAMDENLLDNPTGIPRIGDPGIYIGADDTGYVPTAVPPGLPAYGGTQLWRPTYRHRFSYLIFERFLKNHAFILDYDQTALVSGIIPFERLGLDLQNVVLAGKSAYTYMLIEPDIPLLDQIGITDVFGIVVVNDAMDTEVLEAAPSALTIGEGSLLIGDYFKYEAGGTVDIQHAPWPGPLPDSSGYTPIWIGGEDPMGVIGSTQSYGDWPVQIAVTTV